MENFEALSCNYAKEFSWQRKLTVKEQDWSKHTIFKILIIPVSY